MRLIGTPGRRTDIVLAHDLIASIGAKTVLADKGYDADHLIDAITRTGAIAVIPPKRDRSNQRRY